MTKVEAYIRTHVLKDVQEALEDMHISGLTVSDVRGMGHSKGITHTFRGNTYTTNLNPRVKIEAIVLDSDVEEVVALIQKAAQTGEIGDGKIALYPVGDIIRIRTGERGETALH
jgi:nitrogen regulatory protein P-II 1